MNKETTFLGSGRSDNTDITANTQITDFTQVVSCAVGRDRHELRSQRIRAELVREHFSQDSAAFPSTPSLRNRLLKLLKFD